MTRPALAAGLLALAAAASAQPAPRTALYADAVGPTGLYALGVERAVWTAGAGERQLRLRAGAAYWTESIFFDAPTDHVLTVPVGVATLFSLGRPLGLPAAFEFGGGAVFVRRGGERFGIVGESFALPAYGEAAVRVAVGGGVGVRAGLTAGGERSDFDTDGVRPCGRSHRRALTTPPRPPRGRGGVRGGG